MELKYFKDKLFDLLNDSEGNCQPRRAEPPTHCQDGGCECI